MLYQDQVSDRAEVLISNRIGEKKEKNIAFLYKKAALADWSCWLTELGSSCV